jgi:hypothetical protein
VYKSLLPLMMLIVACLIPAQAGAESAPVQDRHQAPYSVAQVAMPGSICARPGMQFCARPYLMVCRCAPNQISGCRWAHTGIRC